MTDRAEKLSRLRSADADVHSREPSRDVPCPTPGKHTLVEHEYVHAAADRRAEPPLPGKYTLVEQEYMHAAADRRAEPPVPGRRTLGEPAYVHAAADGRAEPRVPSRRTSAEPDHARWLTDSVVGEGHDAVDRQPATAFLAPPFLDPPSVRNVSRAPIQAKFAVSRAEHLARTAAALRLHPTTDGGQALPDLVRQKMERAFGADFSTVRVHEGEHAAKLGARAFARGEHIHFQPGGYDPTTVSGQELLGHELAHVVQQRAGRVAQPQAGGGAINTDEHLEREADEQGSRAARGEPAGGPSLASGTADNVGVIQRHKTESSLDSDDESSSDSDESSSETDSESTSSSDEEEEAGERRPDETLPPVGTSTSGRIPSSGHRPPAPIEQDSGPSSESDSSSSSSSEEDEKKPEKEQDKSEWSSSSEDEEEEEGSEEQGGQGPPGKQTGEEEKANMLWAEMIAREQMSKTEASLGSDSPSSTEEKEEEEEKEQEEEEVQSRKSPSGKGSREQRRGSRAKGKSSSVTDDAEPKKTSGAPAEDKAEVPPTKSRKGKEKAQDPGDGKSAVLGDEQEGVGAAYPQEKAKIEKLLAGGSGEYSLVGGQYVIVNPPLDSSGDIYHILGFLAILDYYGLPLPEVRIGYHPGDGRRHSATETNARRGAEFAAAIGFTKVTMFQYSLEKHRSRPNTKSADMRSGIAGRLPFMDQKVTTVLISAIMKKVGSTRITDIIRNRFTKYSKSHSGEGSSEEPDREGQSKSNAWIEEQMAKIRKCVEASAEKKLVILNHRTAANQSQHDTTGKDYRAFEKQVVTCGYAHYRLWCGGNALDEEDVSAAFPNLGTNGVNSKVLHLQLLARIKEDLGGKLLGIYGGTTGTLDAPALIGIRALSFHALSSDVRQKDQEKKAKKARLKQQRRRESEQKLGEQDQRELLMAPFKSVVRRGHDDARKAFDRWLHPWVQHAEVGNPILGQLEDIKRSQKRKDKGLLHHVKPVYCGLRPAEGDDLLLVPRAIVEGFGMAYEKPKKGQPRQPRDRGASSNPLSAADVGGAAGGAASSGEQGPAKRHKTENKERALPTPMTEIDARPSRDSGQPESGGSKRKQREAQVSGKLENAKATSAKKLALKLRASERSAKAELALAREKLIGEERARAALVREMTDRGRLAKNKPQSPGDEAENEIANARRTEERKSRPQATVHKNKLKAKKATKQANHERDKVDTRAPAQKAREKNAKEEARDSAGQDQLQQEGRGKAAGKTKRKFRGNDKAGAPASKHLGEQHRRGVLGDPGSSTGDRGEGEKEERRDPASKTPKKTRKRRELDSDQGEGQPQDTTAPTGGARDKKKRRVLEDRSRTAGRQGKTEPSDANPTERPAPNKRKKRPS